MYMHELIFFSFWLIYVSSLISWQPFPPEVSKEIILFITHYQKQMQINLRYGSGCFLHALFMFAGRLYILLFIIRNI